jgi:tetratricopeptide (TPR) repeat protein
MELIGDTPLTRYCDGARLSVRARLELFVPVCQAVQHAHQKGVIHRDLKPSNVLVTVYDGKPVPKVIDFGIAKAAGVKLTEETLSTEFGSVLGTLQYMSPEQAEPGQLDVDTRSDIYSLGVMLYELLTGTTPLQPARLEGASLLDMLRAVRESEPPRPSTRLSTTDELSPVAANRGVEPRRLIGTVRGDLDWIVMKCLEKDRTRRYETADALARDLERFLSQEPVEACPPSRTYRLRKFAHKNRNLLLGAGAFVLLLTVATAVSVWMAVRATLAERAADAGRAQAVAEKERADEQAARATLAERAADAGRAQAVTEKERADEQAAVAEAVNNFLNRDLLFQGSPEQSPDRDLKMRAVLDRASKKVEGRFASQPVVEARIRTTLGDAYQSLGEHALAREHARRAYELYRDKLGPLDPHTVGAMNNVATSLFYDGKLEEAEKLYVETLELEKQVFGPEDRITLATMSNLGAALAGRRKLEDAEKLLKETLEIQQRVHGEGHRETLKTMMNLAGTYGSRGKRDDARQLYQKTLDLQRQHLGPADPHTLFCALRLSGFLTAEGRHQEAYELRDEVLKEGSRSLPPGHPTLVKARKLSAYSLWWLGRFPEAIKRFDEVLQLQRPTLTADDPELRSTLHPLAWLLATTPDPRDRDPRRAVELAKELADHLPKDGGAWTVLGVTYYRAGDWKQAITALEKSEAVAPREPLATNALFLAMAHWRLQEKEEARKHYGRALRWIEENKTSNEELLRFKAEAAQLLGMPKAQAPEKKDSK